MSKTEKILTKHILKSLRGSTRNERLLHRLHCVIAVVNGLSASQIARLYGSSPRAVSYWVTQFKKAGVEGLKEDARPGRPTTLTESQMKALQTFIKRMNDREGEVTSKKVATFILKEFKISVNSHLAWRILKKLNP